MRHRKHRQQLGVKKEHRAALLANLASSLIDKGRIRTTTTKAKALRPYVEKLITLTKKGEGKKIHQRRLAASRLRNPDVVKKLFDERASEFTNREGGYTRIYKLALPRLGDAADMAIIELVGAGDTGYQKGGRRRAKSKAKPATETTTEAAPAAEAEAKAE